MDDFAFDDLDALADVDAFGLDDDEVLCLGVAAVPDEAAETTACAEHDGLALGLRVGLALGLRVGLELGLELGLRVGLELGLELGPELGLGLLVAVGVLWGLGLPLALELALPLAEGLVLVLALGLTLLLLLGVLVAEVTGAAVVACVRPGEVVFATVVDAGADDDAHPLGELTAAAPAAPLDPGPSAVEGCGALLPPPSVVPGPLEELLLPVMAELR